MFVVQRTEGKSKMISLNKTTNKKEKQKKKKKKKEEID